MSMNLGTATAYIDLDASRFQGGLRKASQSLDATSRQFRKNESEFKSLGTTLNGNVGYFKRLDLASKSLGNQLRASQSNAKTYKTAMDDTSRAVKQAQAEHTSLGQKLSTLQGHLQRSNQMYGEGSKQSQMYAKAIDSVNKQQSTLESEIEKGNIAIEEFGIAMQGAETQAAGLQKELKNFKLKQIGQDMKSVGQTLTRSVTLPLAGAGLASIKVASDFEAGMSKVSALSGATGKDLKMLEDKAREMGASTKFSATEASEAMSYMALAGWDANEMAAGLEPTLKLAGAAGMDLARTSDIVTDTLSMFGLKAQDATKMTDILAYAQANSNTSVDQLGEALKYCGASANAMGYDIADTSALLGVLADSSLKGSVAGTTLNSMFRDMKKHAKGGAIEIGKTKVAIVDSNGKYRDMADILADVEKATKGMTKAQKDQALSSIWGTEALKGVNIAMETGSDKLKSLEDGIRSSDGAAKEMYDTMQNNLKGSIDNMKSALEGAGISIGKILIPAIRDLVDRITDWLTWFNSLDEGTQRVIVAIGATVAAIGPLLLVFGTVLTMIPNMVAGWGILAGAMGGFTLGIPALIGGLVLIAAKIGSSTSALDFLVDKFGFVGEFIATICESIWGTIQLTFGNIMIIIQTVGKLIAAVFKGEFHKLDDITREGWAKVENNTAKALSNMNADTTKALKLIETQSQSQLEQISNVFDVATAKLPELTKHNVGQAATAFTNALQGIDKDGLTILKGTSDNMAIILEGISADMIGTKKGADKMRENLESLAVAGGVSAKDLEKDISQAMKTINDNMVTESDKMRQNATNAFNAFKTVGTSSVKEMANNVVAEIGNMDQGSVEKLSSMGETWKSILSGIKDDGSMSSSQMRDAIVQNLSDMGITGSQLVSQLRTESTNHMNQMANEADQATKKGADAVSKNTGEAKAKATENARGAKEGSKKELDQIPKDVENATQKAKQSMDKNTKEGAKAVSNNMKQTSKVVFDESGKIPKDVQGNMQKSVQAMRQAGSDIYNGMNTSFSKLASQGKAHFSNLYNGVTNSTSKMANKTISDWNRIRSALSSTITGHVKIQVHGVQAALNQINSVKNAAKSRAATIENSFVDTSNMNGMYMQAYDLIRSDDIASCVTSQIPSSIKLDVETGSKKKNNKSSSQNINVEVKIDKFVNETKESANEFADRVIERVIYKTKRERLALGGAR